MRRQHKAVEDTAHKRREKAKHDVFTRLQHKRSALCDAARRGGLQQALASALDSGDEAAAASWAANLTHDEKQTVLIGLKEALTQEMSEQEAEMVVEAELARLVDAEEALHHAKSIEEKTSRQVTCPVCGRNELGQVAGVVVCSCGGVRLPLREEKDGLRVLSEEIVNARADHAVTSCPWSLTFKQSSAGGISVLVASCQMCGFLDTVP